MIDNDLGEPDSLVGIGHAAAMFGVSRESIRNFEKRGILPPATRILPGDRRVWKVATLEAVRDRVTTQRSHGPAHGDAEQVA
ncbi:MAG: hypothetical protein M3Q71_18645 [Chloroflexota bacterium]|nr:hypothetical protein [Chloroflexota bacterium]